MEEDKKALRDSGERTQYQSGAVRDRKSGKGRYDLTCPHADFREARVFEKGAEKYAERNWERGMPVMNFLDSAKRHLNQLLEGDQLEDHAAQARWNISCYMETLYRIEKGELPESFDNRPPRMKPNYIPPYIPPAIMKESADLLAESMKKPGVAEVEKFYALAEAHKAKIQKDAEEAVNRFGQ